MSAIPHVHHRRHIIVPDLIENTKEENAIGTEKALFKAACSSGAIGSFYATIVNGTPNIDLKWIASHPAGLRQPKHPTQLGLRDSKNTSNVLGVPFSPILMATKTV